MAPHSRGASQTLKQKVKPSTLYFIAPAAAYGPGNHKAPAIPRSARARQFSTPARLTPASPLPHHSAPKSKHSGVAQLVERVAV